MLSYLLFFAKADKIPNQFCEAPLTHADPVANGKLLHAQIFIRHGARSPGNPFGDVSKTGDWVCDDETSYSPRLNPAPVVHPKLYRVKLDPEIMPFKPNCRKKDLLVTGMKELYDLGQFYKKYYIEEQKLLGEKYYPWNVLFRGTELDRTLRSGVSFLQGMFPPASPNEVVNYITDNAAAGILHPGTDWCPDLEEAANLYFNTQEWNQIFTKLGQKYQTLFTQHGISWDYKSVKKFASYVVNVDCTNHTTEDWLTQEILQDMMEYMGQYNRGPYYYKGNFFSYAASPTYREMFRIADEKISMQNDYRFALHSTHDTALLALLAVLGYKEDKYGPSFRSHLAFELWEVNERLMARFVFNGKPVKLELFDNQVLVPYSNLKMAFASNGYLSHCMIPNWPK